MSNVSLAYTRFTSYPVYVHKVKRDAMSEEETLCPQCGKVTRTIPVGNYWSF